MHNNLFARPPLIETLIFTIFVFCVFCAASCRTPAGRPPLTEVRTYFGLEEKLGEPFGVAVKDGELFVADGETGRIWRIPANGRSGVFAEGLHTPSQIAFDRSGDLLVADAGTHTIKRIKPAGTVETIAGVENRKGFADGEADQALFNAPVGIAVTENRIFVADTYNDRIRVIENNRVSTLAGSTQGFADADLGSQVKFDTPCGLAVTADGRLLVADTANRRLRVVEPNGRTWTLAGNGASELTDGSLSATALVQPVAVAVDDSGGIYIADASAVRVIETHFFPILRTISDSRRGFVDGQLNRARFNRPSGLATDGDGNLFVADSENQVVRVLTGRSLGRAVSAADIEKMRLSPQQFRQLQEPRWTYDPPLNRREIAGTLGEIRGEIDHAGGQAWFHNGLDIVGGYGETARFVRSEKVLRPLAAENFETLRELLRMPTLGYIHIRLGRGADNKLFDDNRFQFSRGEDGRLRGVRVPRGTRFEAGEAIGTLNAMNHVHLVAGPSGAEMNALDALIFPGISDKIVPVIEKVSLYDENWREIETGKTNPRINLSGKIRIVVRAYDRMDGNAERRRLGVYRVGYQVLRADRTPFGEPNWTIRFDRLPEPEAVRLVYAQGSRSGPTGETIFNYIVSNEVNDDVARENMFDPLTLDSGSYILRVFAADFFGNSASADLAFEVRK